MTDGPGGNRVTDGDGPGPAVVLDRSIVVGGVEVGLGSAIERYGCSEVHHRTTCSSGDPIVGRWSGIPLVELLSDVESDATHLAAESADGFRVCIPVLDALDGILAVGRLDAEPNPARLPRLIAPALSGTRLVKRVVEIDGERLSPSDDPGAFEELRLEQRES